MEIESKLRRKFDQRNELHRLIFRNKYHPKLTSKHTMNRIQQLCQANDDSLNEIADNHPNMDRLWQFVKCEDEPYTMRKEQALTILLEMAQRSQYAPFNATFTLTAELVTYLTQLLSPSASIQHTKLSISLLTIWINTAHSKSHDLQMEILHKLTALCTPHSDFEILSNICMFLHQMICKYTLADPIRVRKISKLLNFLLIYSQCEILWIVLSAYIRLLNHTEINGVDLLNERIQTDTLRMQINKKLTADDLLVCGWMKQVPTIHIPTGIHRLILNFVNPFAQQKIPPIHSNPLSKMVALLRHKDYLVYSKAIQALHTSAMVLQNDGEAIAKLFHYGVTSNIRHLVWNGQGSESFVFLLNVIYFADKYEYYQQMESIGVGTFMYGLTQTIFKTRYSICAEFEQYVLETVGRLVNFYRNTKRYEDIERMKAEVWKLEMDIHKTGINKGRSCFLNQLLCVID